MLCGLKHASDLAATLCLQKQGHHTPKALRTVPDTQWVLNPGVKCRFRVKAVDSSGLDLGKQTLPEGWAVPRHLSLTPFFLGPSKMAWLWPLCALFPAFLLSGECLPPLGEQY